MAALGAEAQLRVSYLGPDSHEPEPAPRVLKALRTLVTIARHGTFARAADLLSLTPSAVSLHIKTLEDELQVALFDRSRRQVVLTEAGQLAVARAEGILAAYDELADTLANGPSLRGRLRIGAIHTVLARRLPKALVWIKTHHPQLHVSVVSGMSAELARRIEDGELDAAITTEPVSPYPGACSTQRCSRTASGPSPARNWLARACRRCLPASRSCVSTNVPGPAARSNRSCAASACKSMSKWSWTARRPWHAWPPWGWAWRSFP